MSAIRRLLRRADALWERVLPWFLGLWFISHALGHHAAGDSPWRSLAVIAAGWVLYDWAEKRGRHNDRQEIAERIRSLQEQMARWR